jgi:quinoprotein glucose dehydrogenase
VRFFAALSLGKIGHKPAVDALCCVLSENNDADPILRHGAIMGLAGCATTQELVSKTNDASAAVRGGAVVALRRQKSPQVAAFLQDADASVVLEAARAIHDLPITDAFPALAAALNNAAITDPNVLGRAINAHYRLGQSANAQALAAFAAKADAPETARKDALDALSLWENPSAKDRLLNNWRPLPARGSEAAVAAITPAVPALLTDSSGSIQEIVAQLSAKLSLRGAGEPLYLLASNDRAAIPARIEAIKALASLKDERLAAAAKVAVKDKNAMVRSEGLQALAAVDPVVAVQVIGEIVQHGGPGEKQGAVLALAQIQSPAADAQLSALLDQLIAGTLAAEVQLDVLEAAQPRAALKDKLAQYQATLPPGDELAPWKVSLAGGSVERGRKLFREKAETQCLRCHKNEIGDSLVGPELTRIGKTKDRAYLLESIVQPNKTIAEGFETVVLTLNDGNITAGRLVGNSPEALKIETMNEQGKPQVTTVPVAQIKERMGAPSPMPPSGMFLSKSEMRDLIEYLATRK